MPLSEPQTPALVFDRARVRSQIRRFQAAFPGVRIHYPYKCCGIPAVVEEVLAAGESFEVASIAELHTLVAHGARAREIIFSAPVKRPADIETAFDLGVERYVADSSAEIEKLARLAPGAEVLVRFAVSNDTPFTLSEKFGAERDEALHLVERAASLGLRPRGTTFHVGSPNLEVGRWRAALAESRWLMEQAAVRGIRLDVVNIGGGFPVTYGSTQAPSLESIADACRKEFATFPSGTTFQAEPGRVIVAEAGTLHSTIIGTALRRGIRWIYTDVGAFNGLLEAFEGYGGGLGFRVENASRPNDDLTPVTIAGPSCDGLDIIARDTPLPATTDIGDQLVVRNTGAYTLSYASNFCGIAPPEVVVVDSDVAAQPTVISLEEPAHDHSNRVHAS